jgi:hypothetical protein
MIWHLENVRYCYYYSWQASCSPASKSNVEIAVIVLTAKSISVQVSYFIGVRSLGDVRSVGYIVALGAEATSGLSSDQRNSILPESPARFRTKVVLLDFDHNIRQAWKQHHLRC